MKLNQKVGNLNSIDDFFNIEISRNVPCYSNKEHVTYTLIPKNTFTTDNIQIVIDKKYYFEKNNNVYTLYQEINFSLNSYLRIIENDEDDDILYEKKIQFTKITFDKYFYPQLNKIIFKCDCNFLPEKFQLNETQITCNKTSDYNINDKNYYCYFNERISSYEETVIFLMENN